jgi:hypothetical protein
MYATLSEYVSFLPNKYKEHYNKVIKQERAYFITHYELGDNINSNGSIHFLLQFYNTIFILAKQSIINNLKILYEGYQVEFVLMTSADYDDKTVEYVKNILHTIPNEHDLFITGYHNYKYGAIKSRITHPDVLNYVPNDKYYTESNNGYNFIRDFYHHIGQDLSIQFEYFKFNSSKDSLEYYNKVSSYKIVFIHSQSRTTPELNTDIIYQLYVNQPDHIMICANKNMYKIEHTHYELANKFVNIPVFHYIDIIKHAEHLYYVDSCFACIIVPLIVSKILQPKTNKLYVRGTGVIMN